MVPSLIVKEILIDAPVEVVWRVVTEPDQLDRWFSEKADFDAVPGAAGRVRMSARTTYNIQVEAIEPHKRFAFRWAHPDGQTPGARNSMLVEFTFHPQAGSTRLRVVESGFDTIDWSEDAKREYFEGHDNGWPTFLARLPELVRSEA